jgi:hypothetical protein
MEELFSQRFNCASITHYKDYCRLDEKKSHNEENLYRDSKVLDNIFDGDSIVHKVDNFLKQRYVGAIFSLPTKQPEFKNTRFFYDTEDNEFILNYVYPFGSKNSSFQTTKDRQIKRHFVNPFSRIEILTTERSIRKFGDKITIKLYTQFKTREFNRKYFSVSSEVASITFNTVTGNFTVMAMKGKGKKRTKTFICNGFKSLVNWYGVISKRVRPTAYDERADEEFESQFSDDKFREKILEVFSNGTKTEEPLDLFLDNFIKIKKIKVPNNPEVWLTQLYPTEKYLKKNDRKLLLSILDSYKIKSKITNKLIHQFPNLDLFALARLCYIFGEDHTKYVASIDPKQFEKSKIDRDFLFGQSREQFVKEYKGRYVNYEIYNTEKENIVRIINSTPSIEVMVSHKFLNDLEDHLGMIKRLRNYIPISLTSRTYKDFLNEHTELTKLISQIKKGWSIQYVFNQDMVDSIETPIDLKIKLDEEETGEITFYPYILKRDEDYNEEGDFMHHCVATYSDKQKSIIVSIRTKDGKDRVTCEFHCQDGKLIQARHFCNKQPPADMMLAVEQLSIKTKKFARLGILHSIEMKKVPIIINGIEVDKNFGGLNQHRFLFENVPPF